MATKNAATLTPKQKALLVAARACRAAGCNFTEPLAKLNRELNPPKMKGKKK